MKIILTGATGFIGGAILTSLLSHPTVTSILVLSRRPLLTQAHPKLSTLIVKDFLNFDTSTLSQLRDADACIWCLGTPTGGKTVHVDYTEAGTRALIENCLAEGKVFRFCYVSGGLVEPDQERSLWFLGKERKMRGQVEHMVTGIEGQHEGQWRSLIVRPGLVTKGESLLRFVTDFQIPVEVLGAALADLAVNGGEKRRLENVDLKARGKAALAGKEA